MFRKVQSDFHFARPSFASGVASSIDMWGQLVAYNSTETPAEADANAILSDWCVVGQDIFDAMRQGASERDAA